MFLKNNYAKIRLIHYQVKPYSITRYVRLANKCSEGWYAITKFNGNNQSRGKHVSNMIQILIQIMIFKFDSPLLFLTDPGGNAD